MVAGGLFEKGRPLVYRKLGKKVTLCISKHSLFIPKTTFFWYNLSVKRNKSCDWAFHNMIPAMKFFHVSPPFLLKVLGSVGPGTFRGQKPLRLSPTAVENRILKFMIVISGQKKDCLYIGLPMYWLKNCTVQNLRWSGMWHIMPTFNAGINKGCPLTTLSNPFLRTFT